ncbi:MAG: retropepsin-like aspartic protease [Methylovulum sp.]|nr:retropepsin-like aspartic protease [Methylovulum sp.]
MTAIIPMVWPGNPLRLTLLAALVLTGGNAQAQRTEDGSDLFGQIEALQNRMHIEISGLERIENEAKALIRDGSLEQQLEQLLAPFNHIISRNTQGKIERVVIINKKQQRETERIVLPTHAQGRHLMVSVSLSGDGRLWQTLDMIIDTGADLIVLPESMIAGLGLTDSPFTRHNMQTANGMTEARVGMLRELKIAGETVENVEVAFIADPLLAGNRLLGMSLLGRYQLHIDDKSQLITLFKK